MRTVVRRTLAALVLLILASIAWFVVYGGRFLQHEDPLQKSDAIFVLAGARAERALEAVDLYKEGWAPLIVLSGGRVEAAESWLEQRGVRFPRETETLRGVMGQLGVPQSAIVLPPESVDNTGQEANMLRAMVQARHWRRVIIVTSKYHTRRAAFAFRRGLENTGAEPIMRATRYDPSDPARWLQHRADFRFAGSEWLKLIFYRLGG
jgi:uncharacterized SAM-binding protein YcdF (DUF218 family)